MPVSPLNTSSILFSNRSDDAETPKGSLNQLSRPKTVLNVVNYEDSSSNWILQYACVMSSVLKYLASVSFDVTSSSVGIG
ncbi:hypothetical protein DPMN_083683 [Dreissena polymorpha]|uniref:Uncharacterized protein n=1 Tax=Dreissena polymorpha TaxID=45954 RepID=A0A9D4BK35_DREPO|nr:hypothetical protein DPMN_083683 [Dreissena polymorpha]